MEKLDYVNKQIDRIVCIKMIELTWFDMAWNKQSSRKWTNGLSLAPFILPSIES